jgi:hypothetical protein
MPRQKDLNRNENKIEALSAFSSEPVRARELSETFVVTAPLLKDEDRRLYTEFFKTLVDETGSASLLELTEANDYVNKLFQGRRYDLALAKVIDDSRAGGVLAKSERREDVVAKQYLPIIEGLSKLSNSSYKIRAQIAKDMKKRLSKRDRSGAPSIVPDSNEST